VVPVLPGSGLVGMEGVRSEVERKLGRLFLGLVKEFEIFSENLRETAFHKIIEFIYREYIKFVQ
jgi:hypothetical protein